MTEEYLWATVVLIAVIANTSIAILLILKKYRDNSNKPKEGKETRFRSLYPKERQ